MTFPDALRAALAGAAIRRTAWGVRRVVRIMLAPWNGAEERLLLTDAFGKVSPSPFFPTGEDLRADDWMALPTELHTNSGEADDAPPPAETLADANSRRAPCVDAAEEAPRDGR